MVNKYRGSQKREDQFTPRRIKYELKKRLPRNGVGGLKGKPNGVGFDTFLRIIRSTLLAQPAAVTEMDALAAMYDSPERPGVIKGHPLYNFKLLEINTEICMENYRCKDAKFNFVICTLRLWVY